MSVIQDRTAAAPASADELRAYFIINCGILLDYKGHQILVDGLFCRPAEAGINKLGLATPSDETVHQIMNREGIYSNIEYILCTHEHWDHGNRAMTDEYVSRYGATAFYPTEDETDYTYENDWLKLEALSCIHDLPSNPDGDKHCCYRLTIDGRVCLFTGDVDVLHEIPEKLYDTPVDIMFYNIHHILVPQGRAALIERFRPGHTFIQHLPDPEDDPFGVNKRAVNKLQVYGKDLPPYTLLDETKALTRIL